LPRINVDGRGIVVPGSPAALGPEASKAVSSIEGPARTKSIPEPVIFPGDLEKLSSGEGYQLGLIVQGAFAGRNWEKAGDELKRFLDLPRSARGECRARFYLGQCYYFSGNNREALFEFLAAQECFPEETFPWLRAVLEELGNTRKTGE
jgi:TolA-binding protein